MTCFIGVTPDAKIIDVRATKGRILIHIDEREGCLFLPLTKLQDKTQRDKISIIFDSKKIKLEWLWRNCVDEFEEWVSQLNEQSDETFYCV